jgi:hypothetical protein
VIFGVPCRRLLAVAAALAALAGGCGKNAVPQPAEKAEAALDQFLAAWTRGEPADTFSGPEKPLQATDPDWMAGYRLSSFLTVESTANPERPGQIRCRVALTLRDPGGKQVDKEVVYEVELGETIAIQRGGR